MFIEKRGNKTLIRFCRKISEDTELELEEDGFVYSWVSGMWIGGTEMYQKWASRIREVKGREGYLKSNGRNLSLCWDCANACSSGCSWSKSFKPVDGWKADRHDIKISSGYNGGLIESYDESYMVYECPQFERG